MALGRALDGLSGCLMSASLLHNLLRSLFLLPRLLLLMLSSAVGPGGTTEQVCEETLGQRPMPSGG